MKISTSLPVLAAGFIVAIVACSGGSGDAGSGDAGIEGGRAEGGTGACATGLFTGQRVCVPAVGSANTPITVQAEAQGCTGCGNTLEECKVTVDGSTISLSLVEKSCSSTGECPAICGIPQATCTIPPLAAGRYSVEIVNAPSVPTIGGRELVIGEGGTASCTLVTPAPATDIEAAAYDRTCTTGDDATCELVSVGDACQRCAACPSAAVAKSAAETLRGDYRKAHAQCMGSLSAECEPCPQTLKAVCNAGTCTTAPL